MEEVLDNIVSEEVIIPTEEVQEVESIGDTAEIVAKQVSNKIDDPVVFDRGDLCLKCHVCKHEQVLQENVVGGLRFDLYTTDQHKIIFHCKACGTRMEMFYKPSAPLGTMDENLHEIDPTIVQGIINEGVTDEPVLEENKA